MLGFICRYKDGMKILTAANSHINSTGNLGLFGITKYHAGVYRCFVEDHGNQKLAQVYSINVACKYDSTILLSSSNLDHSRY